MEGNWVLKVNTKQKMPYDLYRLLHRKSTKYRNNYCFNNYVEKPKRTIKKIQKAGIKYECYRVEYERANNYRQTFFARTQAPYRCRYCNKKLQKNKVVVDHIVPVASARMMLAVKRCGSVNDIRNLAPACRDCNSKKSDKMGLWVVRGWLGKYKLYWIILRIIQIVCILLMICGGVYLAKKNMLFV